jgi:hypothetical protein
MFYNPSKPESVEKYSSAVTLSDMEIFIFPELLYSLVLANIMSPALWKWRDDPWFAGIRAMSPQRRVQRLKQYIMDNYAFNLDLDTWGLTTKERELVRFSSFISTDALAQSNALFGYEGDKYYFDVDIRKHFGLDKYTDNIIPYWKTETIEAMNAFKHKPSYNTGAGECVSLSTLYAAALFVVAEIPLSDIYLMATPLHSQNFIDVKDGIITNNRRIVTKTMWYNGTELSDKARRAIENERITVVANNSGYIHILFPEATISKDDYGKFTRKLKSFLKTNITFEILANFLRSRSSLQKCFQIAHTCCGKPRYIEAEKMYAYEHNSKSRVGDATQTNLLHEIDEDEFYPNPIPNRIMLSEIETFFEKNPLSVDSHCNVIKLKQQLQHTCFNVETVVQDLIAFCSFEPRLPEPAEKKWVTSPSIILDGVISSEDAVQRLAAQRSNSIIADLAFASYRDLKTSPWKPFLKAALERNPVSIEGAKQLDEKAIYDKFKEMPDESIYDGSRLSQPDEVWNYGRGDGLEKAVCLVNILRARYPEEQCKVHGDGKEITVIFRTNRYSFTSIKNLTAPSDDDFSFK